MWISPPGRAAELTAGNPDIWRPAAGNLAVAGARHAGSVLTPAGPQSRRALLEIRHVSVPTLLAQAARAAEPQRLGAA